MWKTIKEFPLYEISDRGVVRNRSTLTQLKAREKKGKMEVTMATTACVANLVYKYFVCQKMRKNYSIIHINGDNKDFSLDNLKQSLSRKKLNHLKNYCKKSKTRHHNITVNKYLKFKVVIQRNRRQYYLGSYDSLQQAINVRDRFLSKENA